MTLFALNKSHQIRILDGYWRALAVKILIKSIG